MFESIKGIKIQGRCFSAETELDFFQNAKERLSIVFGRNGSGKSTISESFSLYGQNIFDDSLQIQPVAFTGNINIEPAQRKRICVFNEKYTEEKIKIKEDGINSIVMFGPQVILDAQLEQVKAEKKELDSEQKHLQEEVNNYSTPSDKLSPEYYYNLLVGILKRDSGWAGTDREIKSRISVQKTNTPVNDAVVKRIINCASEKTLDELQKEFDSKNQTYISVDKDSHEIVEKVPVWDIPADIDTRTVTVLKKKIVKPQLTEREQKIMSLIQNGDGLTNIQNARKRFSDPDVDMCPYCFQSVTPDYREHLLSEIDTILNKDVEDYKKELQSLKISLFPYNVNVYEQLDGKKRDKVRKCIESAEEIIEKHNSIIDSRENDPYSDFDENTYTLTVSDIILEVNEALAELESARQEFNRIISDRNKIKNELCTLNDQIACRTIENDYKTYLKQNEEKEQIEKKISRLTDAITENEKQERTLEEQKKSIKIAQKRINALLTYVFFSREKLTVEPVDGTYHINSNGQPVKPDQISCGERNILGLCYFFTDIFSNEDEKDLYKDEYLLVIDDPVSSFDRENRVGVMSLLRYQFFHFLSGNQKTKIIVMTHDLGAFYDFGKTADEIKEISRGISILRELDKYKMKDFQFNKSNEYSKLIRLIYNFAVGNNQSEEVDFYIGNVVRRVLEAYSTFVYRKGIEEISYTPEILALCKDNKLAEYFENSMYRLVLNGESHSAEKAKSLDDFCTGISHEEKVRTAKDILCFLYFINELHVTFQFKDDNSAIETIKEWCEALPHEDIQETVSAAKSGISENPAQQSLFPPEEPAELSAV
jgi:hypothetical protein